MYRSLGLFVVRRRVAILVASVIGLVLAGAFGGSVTKVLSTGGFQDPAAPSTRAERSLAETFGSGEPNMVLLVTARGGDVDTASIAGQAALLTQELGREPGVTQSASYWTLGRPAPLASTDHKQGLVLAFIEGSEDDVRDRIDVLGPKYTRVQGDLDIKVGGVAEAYRQVGTQIEHDLTRAEMVALPLTLILLVLVFGSVVAASLPLAVGAFAVIGTLLLLRMIAAVTDVSIFALNLTTAMGLGLAIDYSLFTVSRFREELRHGRSVEDAVVRTVETAGRTIAFSALTVGISLAALVVFPLYFLRSFAYAGIGVALLAAVGAVVVLPALLAVLGARVDKLTLWHREPKEVGEGFWHRLAMAVMRRPIPIATVVVLFLVFLGLPFLGVKFGLPDDRVLPKSAPAHVVSDQIRTNFAANETNPILVVSTGQDPMATNKAAITAYANHLSAVRGVARVDTIIGSFIGGRLVAPPGPAAQRFRGDGTTWLSVVPGIEAMSIEAEQLVKEVRALRPPFPVVIGGQSAQLVDSKASIFSRVPLAAGLIGLTTFVLLFLMFGSILVPVKALVLNLLSLSATFGAMVWIFQEGHLSGLLGFTATGILDTTTPILMFCVAFGLSMDYEVFLLSRIKEEHDRTGFNVQAVAAGLEHTGRIVTAAAAILAVVFLAFGTSQVTFIKLFGIGLTLAVIMDATLIRATLVPAFMRLAGELNWWAPGPLKRVYERFSLSESAPEEPAPVLAHH